MAGLACTLIALAGCGRSETAQPIPLPSPIGNEQAISQANLVHLWPLSIDAGTLTCRAHQDALFLTSDGTAYALNGRAAEHGYLDISAIQNQGAPPLGAMRSLALGLCDA